MDRAAKDAARDGGTEMSYHFTTEIGRMRTEEMVSRAHRYRLAQRHRPEHDTGEPVVVRRRSAVATVFQALLLALALLVAGAGAALAVPAGVGTDGSATSPAGAASSAPAPDAGLGSGSAVLIVLVLAAIAVNVIDARRRRNRAASL
ncbi:MAG: hypothetical protein ABR575_02015 [Actinomycetota bacterium]